MRWLLCCTIILGLAAVGTCQVEESMKAGPQAKTDFFLSRIDSGGNIIWSKTYNNGFRSSCHTSTIVRDGMYVLVGWADSCTSRGFWMMVADSNGNIVWDKCYVSESKESYAFPSTIFQQPDRDFVVAGDVGSGGRKAWLLGLSEQGDTLWSHSFDNVGDCCRAVPSSDGGIVLIGNIAVPNKQKDDPKNYDGWILKTDNDGNEKWRQTYGDSLFDYFYDAAVLPDGRIIAVGESGHTDSIESDGWVVIVDSVGNLIHNRIYGKTIGIRFWSIQAAPDGGFLLTGQTCPNKNYPCYGQRYLLMKISEDGDSLWSYQWEMTKEYDKNLRMFDDSEKPLGKYIDEIVRSDPPYHASGLLTMTNLWGITEQMGSTGYPGRISGRAGIYGNGYFFAGFYVHPMETDSTGRNQE
ncbi:MAG: hypothetical protein ACOZB3_01610 [Calditrichota bacterium]